VRSVRVRYTKWHGAGHWTYDVEWLGEDQYGTWVGAGAGLVLRRPAVEVTLGYPSVQLFPRAEPWVAAFNGGPPPEPRAWPEVYIDMTTPPQWSADGRTVTMVDLDLDVVRSWDGSVDILDEDEFAAHRVEFGYPAEIARLAEESCAGRYAALTAGEEPFATVYRSWLALVSAT
jgi:hypothetical protein